MDFAGVTHVFRNGRAFLALAKEEADGLHFDLGHTELMLRGQTLADLGPEMIVA